MPPDVVYGERIEGHRVIWLDQRFECTRCGARLLSLMQFTGRECNRTAPSLSDAAPEGDS